MEVPSAAQENGGAGRQVRLSSALQLGGGLGPAEDHQTAGHHEARVRAHAHGAGAPVGV